MIKILRCLCLGIFCCNCVNLYAGALDDLVSQKKAEIVEQKKQAENKKKKEKVKAQMLENIADCEQSIAQAIEHRKFISKDLQIKAFGKMKIVDENGFVERASSVPRVFDFAPEGVFLEGRNDFNDIMLVYTKDTDYATNDFFRHNDLIYEKVGNYRYKTVLGGTTAVRAFKATKHKVSDISPETYLKNKNLTCCQCWNNNVGFNEVGIREDSECKTRNHPNGEFGLRAFTCNTW